jgi:hypothetical protein
LFRAKGEKIRMKNIKSIISMISVLSILILTFNILLVQAAPPSITMILSGEGEVEVTGYTAKDKEIILGSYVSPNTFKVTGQLAYVKFVLKPNTLADPPYHISSINQDGDDISYENPNLVDLTEVLGEGIYEYTLFIVEKQHTIDVTFSQEETATIKVGESDFLGLTAKLTVNTGNGPITFTGVELQDPNFYTVWDITTEEIDGSVTVALYFTYEGDPTGDIPGEDGVRLYRSNVEYPNADVNGDNKITSEDVNTVSAVNPGTGPDDPDWNPAYDINGDGVIDGSDVNIVAGYNPLRDPPGVWEDITDGWERIGETQWLVFGETDHFSIFRCR